MARWLRRCLSASPISWPARLARQYADEWNAHNISRDRFATLNARLDTLLAERGRDPSHVRRSLMTSIILGRDDADAQRQATATGHSPADLRERGYLVGTASEIVDQLGRLAELGVQRVMWQRFDLDDLTSLETMAQLVLPQL